MAPDIDDDLVELFPGIDNFYPGSKRKRREDVISKSRSKPQSEGAWQDRSVMRDMHGVQMPMYTIGALAQAVNKSEKSVRLWISRGYIPKAPYRLPPVIGRDGVRRMGRRLYSKEMIESAVEAFRSRGLLDSPRIEWSRHRDIGPALAESWSQIQAQISNGNRPQSPQP